MAVHVKFEFEGQDYDFDFCRDSGLPIGQVQEIKQLFDFTGIETIGEFMAAMQDMTPKLAQGIYWLCNRRMGRAVALGANGFEFGEFVEVFSEAFGEGWEAAHATPPSLAPEPPTSG